MSEQPDSLIALSTTHQTTSTPPTPEAGPNANGKVGVVMIGLVVVLGIVVGVFGWTLFLKALLWIAVVGCGLAAMGLALAANDPGSTESQRSGYWVSMGVFALVGFAFWILIPPGAAKPIQFTSIPNESLTPQGQRTFAFWNRLYGTVLRGRSQQTKTADEMIAKCKTMASEIEQLSAANVDPDAIKAALSLRTWLIAVAAEGERRSSPEALVGAVVRGFQGDLFGPFLDETATTNALAQSLREVGDILVSTRAILSSRYGTEFARIEF